MKKLSVLFLLTLIGCGPSSDSPDSASISSLEELMEQNPELKLATLEQIRTAARGKTTKMQSSLALLTTGDSAPADNLAEVKPETAKNVKDEKLDADVAKNAQKLIDAILDEYSVKNEFDAGIKVFPSP